ncbi:MAG: hypothetical protein AB7F98_04545, partial [Novosphingobium sp.]
METDWEKLLERIKLAATTAVAVYPLFAGLYITGFLWSAPYDILGALSATDFIFKSSITFFSIAAGAAAYIIVSFVYHLVIVEKISGELDIPSTRPVHVRWSELGNLQKFFTAFINLLIIVFLLFLANSEINKLSAREAPDAALVFLASALLLSNFLRFFFDVARWKVLKVIYIASLAIFFPCYVGYLDFKLDKASPLV